MSRGLAIAVIVFGCCATTGLASEPLGDGAASVTYYNHRADFEAANLGLPVEDFNDGRVRSYDFQICSDPYDSTTSDDCWIPGEIPAGVSLGSSSGGDMTIMGFGFLGQSSIVTGPYWYADFGYLDFPDGVAAVGFDLLSTQVPEMVDIRIYGFSGLIATTQAQANVPGVFFGVRSTEPIARIEYQAPSGSAEALDNLTFGTSALIFQDGFESGETSG